MKFEEEEWKDVVGYEGVYSVSNLGKIKSLDRLISYTGVNKIQKYPSIVLSQSLNSVGYYQVSMSVNNKRMRFMTHRVVADAFCEKRFGCNVVNHIDGNYTNNKSSNLEWVSCAENVRHAISTGLVKIHGERSHFSKFTDSQADIIRDIKKLGIKTSRLCVLLGVHKSCINRIIKGETYNNNNILKTYKNE